MMTVKDQIEDILKKKLKADWIDVQDDTPRHANHPQAKKSTGGHYSVTVVAELFSGKGLLERHKMIYAALKEIRDKIHALAIEAKTPREDKS